MAGGRSKPNPNKKKMGNKRPKRQQQRRQKRRGQRRGQRGGLGRTGLGSVVARGAKSLISTIPGVGGFLSSIADFAFKALKIETGSGSNESVTSYLGLGGEIELKMGTMIVNSSEVSNSNDHGIGKDQEFYTRYQTGRLLSIEVRLIPSSQMQNRQGEWAMSFTPYMSPEDSANYATVTSVPTYNSVASRPGSVFGSATRTIRLAYHVPVSNVFLRMYRGWDDPIGVLSIGFQDTLRDKGDAFTAAEVNPEVVVSGSVVMGSPVIQGYKIATPKIKDLLSGIAYSIMTPKGKLTIKNGDSAEEKELHSEDDADTLARQLGVSMI